MPIKIEDEILGGRVALVKPLCVNKVSSASCFSNFSDAKIGNLLAEEKGEFMAVVKRWASCFAANNQDFRSY